MLKIKGIYDGSQIKLLEPVSLPPNTEVEVLVPELGESNEQAYWERLLALGLIKEVKKPIVNGSDFEPITVAGKPVSETIAEERR